MKLHPKFTFTLPLILLIAICQDYRLVVALDDTVDFNRDIRPILSDNCFSCHGPDENTREADLRLDDENDSKLDRGDYRVINVADPKKSELVARILTTDESILMPPPEFGKQLTEQQKQLLQRWIDQGAKWSKHWAYVTPIKHEIPENNSNWSSNWIDKFIVAGLQSKKLEPAKDAKKIVWLRRVYFDLIGLPPTRVEVDSFLGDSSPDSKTKVVRRLLNSKHFGERMAMYWLDLVRYADTVGYHGDQDHNISPYRDWVIDAFNSNMPFDQFTREQLAGDLLPDATEKQLIASGYNRLLQTTHEGGLQPKEYRAIYAADRVRNVSAVWMGGTLGCAQCHDHKYDPYTMEDFYSMAAFFADIDDEEHFKTGTNSLPTRRNPELLLLDSEQKKLLDQFRTELKSTQSKLKLAKSEKEKKQLQQKQKQIDSKIKRIEASSRKTMITRSLKEPRETRILPRGNFLDETGPVVKPSFPNFLTSVSAASNKKLNRLELAKWLTDGKSDPGLLTARVFVNRMWYLFYGKGLATDLNDFGGQGVPPNHPELLDNLAISFVNSGWDIKKLIEQLVTTRTYQLSSAPTKSLLTKDPENELFGRQSRVRLPAEMIRDNALAVSGLLIDEVGGASVKPYQPAGYYRHLNFPTRRYAYDRDIKQYRRGVYVHWQRQFLHPMLRAFDAPRREECTAERPTSNTPTAALVLLNDPTFVESARVFAERIMAEEKENIARIKLAFRTALSREPDDFEVALLTKLFQSSLAIYEKDNKAAEQFLTIGMKKPKGDSNLVELAAFTQVTRALFNLDEFVSRP